jgi:hypothetical protein
MKEFLGNLLHFLLVLFMLAIYIPLEHTVAVCKWKLKSQKEKQLVLFGVYRMYLKRSFLTHSLPLGRNGLPPTFPVKLHLKPYEVTERKKEVRRKVADEIILNIPFRRFF